MAPSLKAPLPPDLDLDGGYTIRFTAVDPTTGALVAGVTVANASIMAQNLAGSTLGLSVGPFLLVPGPGS